MKLQVTQLRLEAEQVISVVLRNPTGDRLPHWEAGAHVEVTLPSGLIRHYSLCGSHDEPHSYTVAVLLVPEGRGGSREIHQRLRVGDVLDVSEPRNNFGLLPASHYLFIAGGIGVTPLLAMLEELHGQPVTPSFHFLYGGRTRASMAFIQRLIDVGRDRIDLVPQDMAGLPDLAGALAGSPAGTRIYCCGPPPMLEALERLGSTFPHVTIHFERFTAEVPRNANLRAGDETFDVELARRGVTVTVPADKSVLDAVLEVAPDTLFSCTSGFCGTCETKVIAGAVDHRDELLTQAEQQANTSMMICVSRSRDGAKLVLDL